MSTLFLVATPIGNLEDMSPRAIRTLKEVDLIAAEDTRHSRKLLNHFEINTPMTSYFEHSKPEKLEKVIAKLKSGDVALISDAGMPAINDPGYHLVVAAINAGHEVSSIPGASAPLAALTVSGLPSDSFTYLGYPPRKQGERLKFFEKHADLEQTLIFLETPHRLLDALQDMQSGLGDRNIAVATEMTKRFERFFRGRISEAISHFKEEIIRGEFTLVVEATIAEDQAWSVEQLRNAIGQKLDGSQSSSQLAKELASNSGWTKSKVYDLILDIQKDKASS